MPKHLLKLYCVAVYLLNVLTFFQNDYELKLQIIHITNYNRTYWSSPWASMNWYNRSQRVMNVNFTLIKDSGRSVKLDIQAYKFMTNANEYRFFPITMTVDVCKVFRINNFGVTEFLRDYSNIRTCYLKKGYYYVHNGILDDSKLPPYIPRGNYKVTLNLYSNNEFVAELYVVGEVVDKKKDWK